MGSSCGAATILKKISISSCQDKKEIDYCSDVKKILRKGDSSFPHKLHLAGSGRRDPRPFTAGTITIVYTPWTAGNTENKVL